MKAFNISHAYVTAHSSALQGTARVVAQILATIDDPDGNLRSLVSCVQTDPVIVARVLSAANRAAVNKGRGCEIADVFTATAIIGTAELRKIALIGSVLSASVGDHQCCPVALRLRRHALAVGVCCQELAAWLAPDVSADAALAAGLLHNIGQCWFVNMAPKFYQACWSEALRTGRPIDIVEREQFGGDHCAVAGWLARDLGLPDGIERALREYLNPPEGEVPALTALLHVANVLGNALGLSGCAGDQVNALSKSACERLGLTWTPSVRPFFGRVVARVRHYDPYFD